MWPKAGAAAIVLAISGIAAGVLYSPMRPEAPSVNRVSLRVAPALPALAPSHAERAPLAPAPSRHRRFRLGGAALASSVEAPLDARDVNGHPEAAVSEDLGVQLSAVASVRSGSLVPAVVGEVPLDRASQQPQKPRVAGPVRVAGESVGTAFAVTGRSLRAAFKRAF